VAGAARPDRRESSGPAQDVSGGAPDRPVITVRRFRTDRLDVSCYRRDRLVGRHGRPGTGQPCGCTGGGRAMASQLLIAVGFLAATAAVIALARGSTARWERDRRARVAVRADDRPRRASYPGTWMGSRARQAVDALRRHAVGLAASGLRGRLRRDGREQGPPSRPVRGLAGVRPSALVGRLLRRRRRMTRHLTTPRVGGEPPALASAGSRVHGVPTRAFLRRVPSVRRRALALLHRHGPPDSVPQEDSGDRPAAR